MDLNEYNNRLEGVIKDLKGGAHGDLMMVVANDATAMIKKRVIETGTDDEGRKFKPYSTDPMLANGSGMTSSAYNRIAGSKSKRKDLRWVTIKRGGKNVKLFELEDGYKQYRDLHGRQTGFVDFTFTGRMWSNTQLSLDHSKLQEGIAVIRPLSEENYKIMQGNAEQRKPMLRLSGEEVSVLADIYDKGILQIFRNNGL